MSEVEKASTNWVRKNIFQDSSERDVRDMWSFEAFLAGAAWQREQDDVDTQAFLSEHDENVRLHTQLEEVVDLLDKINGAFYCRTSKKEWLALMEQTKPMIQKVRAKYFQYAKQVGQAVADPSNPVLLAADAFNADEQSLVSWARDAYECLGRGADLMPIEQLSQWEGVRAVIESYPAESHEERQP